MEFILANKASYSFYTHVFKNYDKFVKELSKHNIKGDYLSDLEHEVATQNAICKFLGEQILQHIPSIKEVKSNFNNSMHLLFKQNLDAIEFEKGRKRREDKLKTYIKLHYCLQDAIDGNYELEHARILMAIYLKVVSFERDKDGKLSYCGEIVKVPTAKASLIFKYLDTAGKELGYKPTISQLFDAKIGQLVDSLFTSMAVFNYNKDNTVLDDYIGYYGNDKYTTYNEVEVISDDTCENYIKMLENDFNEKLIKEMHILNNGQVF